MRTFKGSGDFKKLCKGEECVHSLPRGLLCMLHIVCMLNLPFYIRDSAWESFITHSLHFWPLPSCLPTSGMGTLVSQSFSPFPSPQQCPL